MAEPLFDFTAPTDPLALRLYPEGERTCVGRPVWALGSGDGEPPTVLMAAGHDRRAVDALEEWRLALLADQGGPMGEHWETADIEVAWVLIHTECGCTEAEHAEHARAVEAADTVDEEIDRQCTCRHEGLPPCTEQGSDWSVLWTAEDATADTPGALAVTRTAHEVVTSDGG